MAVATAKVVVVTKDEHDLIQDFLEFYGAIVGPHNVVVVDNGSTHPAVLAAYEEHSARGVTVVRDERPFRNAVDFMTEHIRSLAAQGTCKFLMLLETDEFIFSIPNAERREYATCAHDVLGYLESLPDDVSVVRYGAFYGSCVDPADAAYRRGTYSRPAAQMTRFYDQDWDKIIVRASAFVRMAQWCHHAVVSHGRKVTSDRLGLLHFHEVGRRRLVERAKPVVHSYGYADTRDGTLPEQLRSTSQLQGKSVACGHKVTYYNIHLRRLTALTAFRTRVGRLPSSSSELDAYASCDDPDSAVRADACSLAALGHGTVTWDELLYHEPAMPHTFEVHHVANTLACLACPGASNATVGTAVLLPGFSADTNYGVVAYRNR